MNNRYVIPPIDLTNEEILKKEANRIKHSIPGLCAACSYPYLSCPFHENKVVQWSSREYELDFIREQKIDGLLEVYRRQRMEKYKQGINSVRRNYYLQETPEQKRANDLYIKNIRLFNKKYLK